MADQVETVVEEVVEEQVVDQEQQTTEEAQAQAKPFDQMTEEEKLELSDEELIKHMSGEKVETEVVEEETEEEGTEQGEEKEFSADEEFDRLSKLSEAEFAKEPREKKGLFYEMKRERAKRQELQQEIEKEREIRKAQLEIMEKMRGKPEQQESNKTETEKVREIIQKKAQEYEEQYGEEYRLSYKDVEALEEAKTIDAKKAEAQMTAKQQAEQQQYIINTAQQKIDAEIKVLKDQGYEDFDHVYKNFIEPIINPEIARDKEEAIHHAVLIMRKVMKGENAMKYAYEHLARLTPEGAKYFDEKRQKATNKKLASEVDKKTTKTSSHVHAKATDGKTKVTTKMLNDDFDKWESKLSEEQFRKVFNGEDVYI